MLLLHFFYIYIYTLLGCIEEKEKSQTHVLMKKRKGDSDGGLYLAGVMYRREEETIKMIITE